MSAADACHNSSPGLNLKLNRDTPMNSLSSIVFRIALLALSSLPFTNAFTAELTWREHFDRGLLQEELHQDLPKAIEHYRANVDAFDTQRAVIAMSLYRLAECYRKLGQMDRAAPLYARIAREFPDQESLVLVSERFVPETDRTALAPANPIDTASFLETLREAKPAQVLTTLAQETNDALASELLKRYHESESKLATFSVDLGPNHLTVVREKALLDSINEQMARHAQFALDYYQRRLEPETLTAPNNGMRPTTGSKQLADHPVTLKALIEELEQMDPDEAFDLLISETDLRIAYNLIADIEAKRAELKDMRTRYRTNHPALKAAERNMVQINLALQSEVDRALEQLRAKLRILELAPRELTEPAAAQSQEDDESLLSEEEATMMAKVRKMAVERPDLLSLPDPKGQTLLHDAVRSGHRKAAEYLLEQGAEVNALDSEGRTPLHHAVTLGHIQLVELLLAQPNIEIDSQTAFHSAPLHLAAESGYLTIVKALVNAGANINVPSKLKHELPEEETPERGRNRGWTFFNTFREGLPKSNEVDFDARRKLVTIYPYILTQQNTPLHLSSEKGYMAISEYLIDNGAHINATNRCGLTPLLYTLALGKLPLKHQTAMIRLLLEKGADPNQKGSVVNWNEAGPPLSNYFDAKRRYSHGLETFSALHPYRDHHPTSAVQPLGWTTPLHIGILISDEITQMLLDHGADINLQNQRGSTPFHVLLKHSNDSIFRNSLPALRPQDSRPFNPLIRDVTGFRAIDFGLIYGRYLDAVRAAIQQVPEEAFDAFITETFWTFLIQSRIESESLEILAELIQQQPEIVNTPGPRSLLPLEQALVKWFSPTMATWLMEHGAKPHLTENLQEFKLGLESGKHNYLDNRIKPCLTILNQLKPPTETEK